MAEIEKYTPRRVNRDVSPESLVSGDRGFLPGDLLDGVNARYFNDGKDFIVKNVKGNVIKEYGLAAGTNQAVGVFVNKRDNSIVYFIHNNAGDHKVVEFDLSTEIFTTLIYGNSLPLQQNRYITQGGILDDLMIWVDNGITYKLNLRRARTGGYVNPYPKEALSLGAYPPARSPNAVKVTAGGVTINHIAQSSWQFAYQYVYKDNDTSIWSPLSRLVAANFKATGLTATDNAIDVNVIIDVQLLGLLKRVNLAYRENGNGDYTIWDSIENPTDVSNTRRFFNFGRADVVSKAEEIRLQDALPPFTNALEIIESRIFLPLNRVGFAVENSFSLITSIGTEVQAAITPLTFPYRFDPINRYFKDGATHGVGIIFYDEFNRPSFVRATRYIEFPRESFSVVTIGTGPTSPYLMAGVQTSQKKFINWTLSGTPPAGMKKYQPVITRDQFYAIYGQAMVKTFRYRGELREGEFDNSIYTPEIDLGGGSSFTDEPTFSFQGHRFVYQNDGLADSDGRQFDSLWFQIPNNFPFTVQKGDLVRISAASREFIVKDVRGPFIDIGLHPSSDILALYMRSTQFVEIYRPSSTKDPRFYEVGLVYDIVDNAFTVTSGRINGDTYTLSMRADDTLRNTDEMKLERIPDMTVRDSTDTYASAEDGVSNIVQRPTATQTTRIESPSPIFEPTDIGYNVNVYAKAAADYGRVHITNPNERQESYYTTLGFSEPYIQGTNINGLSVFNPANQYPLAIERGVIRALKKAGSVLLAIHERETSTLYIGEGFIRQANDFILAKTDSVVGDDRKLQGSYGTINPESVYEVNDQVFYWDAYKGAVVRYSNAGLFPISMKGMETYFYDKGRQLFPYRNSVKVVSGYDYKFKEYLISFGNIVAGDGTIIIPGVTWAFSTKDETWKIRYSFLPEMMASLSLSLFSLSKAQLWHHNMNPLHNNFYGVQYQRSLTYVCNPKLGKNKRYLNIHIKGEIATDPTSETQVVKLRTPEGQESFIPAYMFELDEGKMVAPVLKDINSIVDADQLALRSGEDLISNYVEFEVINDQTTEAPCAQINVVYKTEDFSA